MFLSACNAADSQKISSILSNSFIAIEDGKKYNKTQYINNILSLKNDADSKFTLLSSTESNNIVITEESINSEWEELTGITRPLFFMKRKYYIINKQIQKIELIKLTGNSNKISSRESLRQTYFFRYYMFDNYGIENLEKSFNGNLLSPKNNIRKYLIEYSKLSMDKKDRIKYIANLQGTYKPLQKSKYKLFIFRGSRDVTFIDTSSTKAYETTYLLDKSKVVIKADARDLILKIQSDSTIVLDNSTSDIFERPRYRSPY